MQKFKQQEAKRSRFDKYILNAPARTRLRHAKTEQSTLARTDAAQPTTPPPVDPSLTHIASKLSIRSSKERTGSGRVSRREVVNRQMTKTTMRRMKRHNTEQREEGHEQRMASLKRKVNQLNLSCNQLKTDDAQPPRSRVDGYAREERRKFLMGQLCFTEIDEARIEHHQKFLSNFAHLTHSVKMLPTGNHQERANEAHLLACLRTIDRIFVVLRQMEFAGYPVRTNKFLIDYCTGGWMWLERVFLTETDRDAFTMAVKYAVAASPEQAKNQFSAFLAASHKAEPLLIYLRGLEGLYEHLESSLTEKRLSKLISVPQEGSWDEWPGGERLRKTGERPDRGCLRFTEQLSQVQSRLGAMREITKMSRRKLQQLGRTWVRMQAVG